jgi:VWFA-related protein
VAVALASGLTARGERQERPSPPPPDNARPASTAQADATPPQPRFRTETNFVRVDVYPTADGRPVRDLTANDFEVFEDGKPQKIETFEHVEVRGRIPQEERREPNTMREARALAEDPRSRIFVVFLDTYHTEISGSHRMQRVLVDLLDRIIGPDDLFGVMTPEMSPSDLALSRRTVTTAGFLSKYWNWGRRDSMVRDPIEEMYEACFPERSPELAAGMPPRPCTTPLGDESESRTFYNGIAKEMIARRREKRVLDALGDLSLYLHGLREERKAVVAVSDGWLLYRENQRLARVSKCDSPPSGPQIGVGPDGRLTTDEQRSRGEQSQQMCETDRMHLAQLDDWQTFHDLMDRANRANVSFYPIDSRGLPAADTQIYEDTETTRGVPVSVDHNLLTARIETLRTLADATDGLAVVDSNDIERGVRRIVDDVTSYYLLGYYSANKALDGKFRSIKVKVKRPGVDVRARRGYKAATQEEIDLGQQLSTKAAVAAPPSAFLTAMGSLAGVRPDFHFLTSLSWIAAPLDDSVPGAKSHLWIVGELDDATAKSSEWQGGADAEVHVTAEDGAKIADARQRLEPSGRVVAIDLPDVALGPGDYALRLRVKPAAGGLPFTDTVRFSVPDEADLTGQPRLFRRGPSTGMEFVATADPRYRRTDRIRVEIPLLGEVTGSRAELLDRAGHPIALPVQAADERATDGALTWARAELALAPLAPGDYAIQITVERGSSSQQVVTAFRVVP